MKIGVAGAGFVGIVHAATMATQENSVILFDVNSKRIQDLIDFCEGRTERVPIHETGLPTMLKETYKKGFLRFSTDSFSAIKDSEVLFSCVGTPRGPNGEADLKYVESVAHDIGKVMQQYPGYKLIVNKSTVPVGTAKKVEDIVRQYYTGDFDVASNPETLAEGRAVRDSTMPKRIIVGVNSQRARRMFHELYSPFFLPQQEKIFFMSPESSELTKYACNAYLGSQVVLTNIFANVAGRVGANWRDMIPAILSDIRIGKFVHPGLGFGGSCFRKDISQLYHTIRGNNGEDIDASVMKHLLEQNEHQKLKVNRILPSIYNTDNFSGFTFGVWGLSFKKETNDIRDGSALEVIPDLLKRGATIKAHDPKAIEEFKEEMNKLGIDSSNLIFCEDKYNAIEGCDGLLILNDWKTYKQPDFNTLRERMKRKFIFDGKALLNYSLVAEERDFNYYSIGRSPIIGQKDSSEYVQFSELIEDLGLYK
jgi:UDPglucose 6-dehydrogenase